MKRTLETVRRFENSTKTWCLWRFVKILNFYSKLIWDEEFHFKYFSDTICIINWQSYDNKWYPTFSLLIKLSEQVIVISESNASVSSILFISLLQFKISFITSSKLSFRQSLLEIWWSSWKYVFIFFWGKFRYISSAKCGNIGAIDLVITSKICQRVYWAALLDGLSKLSQYNLSLIAV